MPVTPLQAWGQGGFRFSPGLQVLLELPGVVGSLWVLQTARMYSSGIPLPSTINCGLLQPFFVGDTFPLCYTNINPAPAQGLNPLQGQDDAYGFQQDEHIQERPTVLHIVKVVL